jgi:hypothetical protein
MFLSVAFDHQSRFSDPISLGLKYPLAANDMIPDRNFFSWNFISQLKDEKLHQYSQQELKNNFYRKSFQIFH